MIVEGFGRLNEMASPELLLAVVIASRNVPEPLSAVLVTTCVVTASVRSDSSSQVDDDPVAVDPIREVTAVDSSDSGVADGDAVGVSVGSADGSGVGDSEVLGEALGEASSAGSPLGAGSLVGDGDDVGEGVGLGSAARVSLAQGSESVDGVFAEVVSVDIAGSVAEAMLPDASNRPTVRRAVERPKRILRRPLGTKLPPKRGNVDVGHLRFTTLGVILDMGKACCLHPGVTPSSEALLSAQRRERPAPT